MEVKNASTQAGSLTREYLIETASGQVLVLSEPGGYHASSISPSVGSDSGTRIVHVLVTAKLEGEGDDTRVIVEVKEESSYRSANAQTTETVRAEEVMPAPGATDLSSILTETELPEHALATRLTLLRFAAGERFLQLAIEDTHWTHEAFREPRL